MKILLLEDEYSLRISIVEFLMKKTIMISLLVSTSLFAADYSSVIEKPNASELIQKDLLPPAKVFTMPSNCVTNDKDSIARGAFIFHNLNGGKVKGKLPKGLAKKNANGKSKQYGNCVACHNIEGAVGAGNIGPDLTGYKAIFVDSGVRDNQFVYQKIADPRVENANTHMTVNLTTKLFNEQEICDMTSYIVSER